MNELRIKSKAPLICYLLIVVVFPVQASLFKNVTAELQINFNHEDDRKGDYQFTETSGSGTAWLDFDGDGDLDLLFLNGSDQTLSSDHISTHQLLENQDSKFTNITEKSGIASAGKAMGVCAADVNADRKVDLYVTHFGQDYLYLNQSGGGHNNVFKQTLIDPNAAKNQWSTSCAFGDVDNDGDVDLYVTRYVEYAMNGNKDCVATLTQGYCNPVAYDGQQDALFINDGTGQFTLETSQRGLKQSSKDRGFGVVLTDYDNDQDLDIYVANDGSENRLYVNDGKGQFNDQGLMSGTAINLNGQTEAGMGIALGDVNNDTYSDFLVTHFSMESNTLYINQKNGFFSDATNRYGLLKPTYLLVGWGTMFGDVNNDGFQDLITVNGNIDPKIKEIQPALSYAQPNQVMINQQGKSFKTLSSAEAFANAPNKSSRGLALGDFNNDGLVDLSINNVSDSAEVYENKYNGSNQWLGILLVGPKNNHSAIGAKVKIEVNNQTIQKEIISGGSFLSQSDFRLIFGLGKLQQPINLQVIWPNSTQSNHVIKTLNQYHEIKYPKES